MIRYGIIYSFLIILFLANTFDAFGQSLYYDIIKGGKTVGYTKVHKVVEGNKLSYKIESLTELRIVFMVRVNYNLVESFEDGVLTRGHSISKLNGAVQKETTIKKGVNKYEFDLSSDLVIVEQDKITYTIPETYFSKPKGSVKVFSQVFAEYLDYTQVDDKNWLLLSDDGKNYIEYNQDGIIEVMRITRPYANFNLILNKTKSKF